MEHCTKVPNSMHSYQVTPLFPPENRAKLLMSERTKPHRLNSPRKNIWLLLVMGMKNLKELLPNVFVATYDQ
jgi:hypothetical protein